MFTKLAKRFWNDEQGLELSEYAIMIAIVIAISAAALTLIGTNLNRIFGYLSTKLAGVAAPAA